MENKDFDKNENITKPKGFNFGKLMMGILLAGIIVFIITISIIGCSNDHSNATLKMTAPVVVNTTTPSTFTLSVSEKIEFTDKDEVKWLVNDSVVKTAKANTEDAFTLVYTFETVGTANLKAEISNYKNLTTEAQVSVTKPSLTITAKNSTKIYGDKIPIFEYETKGLLKGDTLQSININPILKSTATQYSAVGDYEIAIEQLNNSKYSITLNTAKLTIIPRNLIARLETSQKVYDGSKNLNTQILFDKVNNDDVSVKYESIEFADKNVSRIKPLAITGIKLVGEASKNYNLVYETFFGDILPRQVKINGLKANDKMYDGNTNVTFADSGALENIVPNDIVGIGDIVASFETADSGDNKKIKVDYINLIGNDSRNYEAVLPNDITANIKGTNRFMDFSPKTVPSN